MTRLVPPFILERMAARENYGRLTAAALFVDISGFSALTDELMQHGQHGAEILAGVMNSVFDPLVHAVYGHGGFITHFSGDAFSALFPDSPIDALAAARAIQTEMKRDPKRETPYGSFHITAKVGGAAGKVAWGIISAAGGRRATYYFQGTAITGAAAAEKAAAPGDLVLDSAFVDQLASGLTTEAVGAFQRVLAVTASLPAARLFNPAPDHNELAGRFFPAALTRAGAIGEFRQVVNVFISLPSLESEEQLTPFMQTVFDLQDRFGGLLNRLDFGDKGAHLLLFWGAPTAHENDVQRALQFILDLQSQTVVPIKAGVTYRIAHAGTIGSTLHGEYTCYGRGVNLAARFMAGAPRGEIWLDEFAAEKAHTRFELDYLGEQPFKGFSLPQKVFVLLEKKDQAEAFYSGTVFGRESEIAALEKFTAPIFNGRFSGLCLIRGEPGIGKSRLVHEYLSRINENPDRPPFSLFVAQTDEILRHSLNPFRYWLRQYFAISGTTVEARNKRAFNRKLDELIDRTGDPELAEAIERLRSFLGALAGLYWPDSSFARLDARSRQEMTLSAIETLLIAECQRQPVLFFWEDIHWIDEDSWAFFPRFLRKLAEFPLVVLATTRPEGASPAPSGIRRLDIELTGLVLEDLGRLAQAHLDGPAAPRLLDLISSRAEGNPFFAEQILRHLREENQLETTPAGWDYQALTPAFLPRDVHAVLIARLDRLTQEIRDVVQTAAVLGREFEIRLLSEMLQHDADLPARVAGAEREAIWSAVSEIRYIFRHALLRDAAYRMQLRARRQTLHALALRSLEGLYGENPTSYLGEMANHALAAGLDEPAFSYSLAAGDAAGYLFALQDAVTHYENARRLFTEGRAPAAEVGQIRRLYLQLGRSLELLNRFKEAVVRYRELADLGHRRGETALTVAALNAEGTITALLYETHDLQRARAVSGQALDLARAAKDEVAEARALWNHLLIERTSAADPSHGIAFGEEAVALARRAGDQELLAILLNDLATIYAASGRLEAASANLVEAEAILRRLHNPSMLGNTYNFLGMLNRDSGRLAAAAAYFEEGRRVTDPIGGLRNFPMLTLNLATVQAKQGDIAAALAGLEALLAMEESFSYRFLLVVAYQVQAMIYFYFGGDDEGIDACQKALLLHDVVPRFARPATHALLARLHLRRGDRAAARAAIDESTASFDPNFTMPGALSFWIVPQAQIEVALADGDLTAAEAACAVYAGVLERLNYRGHMVEVCLMRARLAQARGQTEAAVTALEEGHRIARDIGERQVAWRILYELSRLAADRGNSAAAARYQEVGTEIVRFILDHAGSEKRRRAFAALPKAAELLAGRSGPVPQTSL